MSKKNSKKKHKNIKQKHIWYAIEMAKSNYDAVCMELKDKASFFTQTFVSHENKADYYLLNYFMLSFWFSWQPSKY